MKEIVFILSSLNDVHYQKRVCEFIDNGYAVKVYGFKRAGQNLPELPYHCTVLGEIKSRNYISRITLYYSSIKRIAKECNGKLCFYSSLDIALYATRLIKSPYIYEVCDLTELTINNRLIRNLLVKQNVKIVCCSLHTILTSDGFAEYFNSIPANKYTVVPNKVSQDCQYVKINRTFNPRKIRIGFVGVIRFISTYNFIKAIVENCENVEIHLYGIYSSSDPVAERIKKLEQTNDSVFFHGRFNNPTDLPAIYANIDLVLCAYPAVPSVIYAEPNKLYEALFFDCPIIVSDGTFLGRKVEKLGVGYVIDTANPDDVIGFVHKITTRDYTEKVSHCEAITTEECFNDSARFFTRLNNLLE